MIDVEAVAQKLDRREDAKIVAYREVGLPVFRVTSLITMQEAGSLGAIEEFVLRCISQGVDTTTEMQAFLGLPPKIAAQQLGQLIFEGAIGQESSEPPRYGLTRVGRSRIESGSSIEIAKEQMPLYVDGITRHVVSADPRELWTNLQLNRQGVAVVPPTPRRAPRAPEIDLAEVNRMLRAVMGEERLSKRAVRLDAILGRIGVYFRRAVAVGFKSEGGRRMSIGFAIDGRESEEHEVEYARSAHAERTVLFGGLFNADRRRRDIQLVIKELRTDLPELVPPRETAASGRPILRTRSRSQEGIGVAKGGRILNVYEHEPLLEKALATARRRLLVITPWISGNVVNSGFVKSLAACLERGTEVTIACGVHRRDADEGATGVDARNALAALTEAYQELKIVSKAGVRARVLLVDDAFLVVTSFDWLSYRGSAQRPMKEEEGTIIEDPELIEKYYQRVSKRFVAASGPGDDEG